MPARGGTEIVDDDPAREQTFDTRFGHILLTIPSTVTTARIRLHERRNRAASTLCGIITGGMNRWSSQSADGPRHSTRRVFVRLWWAIPKVTLALLILSGGLIGLFPGNTWQQIWRTRFVYYIAGAVLMVWAILTLIYRFFMPPPESADTSSPPKPPPALSPAGIPKPRPRPSLVAHATCTDQ